jgi:hypothetical protein
VSGGGAVDGGVSGFCTGPTFVPSGNLTCADTFEVQTTNPLVSGVSASYVVWGPCGGYLVWLREGISTDFACVYDPATKKLAGAMEVTLAGDNTVGSCSGAATKLPRECAIDQASYGDGGVNFCAGGAFMMSGDATCAQTFNAQTTNPNGVNGTIATGECGGFLVWLNAMMRYTLACLYDPTTKQLAGATFEFDTGTQCAGAGARLQPACTRPESYADAGAGD